MRAESSRRALIPRSTGLGRPESAHSPKELPACLFKGGYLLEDLDPRSSTQPQEVVRDGLRDGPTTPARG
jgi:hypothetical protein